MSLEIQPQGTHTDCQTNLFQGLDSGNEAPFSATAHVSPGGWTMNSDEFADVSGQSPVIGDFYRERNLAAGQHYSQTFYWAPWGPAHNLPYVAGGKIYFDSSDMFSDNQALGGECCEKTTAILSFGSKVITTQQLTDYEAARPGFSVKITSTGWYTLNLSTTRYYPGITYPADMLSRRSTVSLKFWANPNTPRILPVFLTRFAPSGLNSSNQAKPNSTTTIGLTPDRETYDPITFPLRSFTVSSIQAWASFDDGRTWHGTAVKHSGSSWSTSVTNPASGYVSLRATITNNSGAATVTIPRAYAVG